MNDKKATYNFIVDNREMTKEREMAEEERREDL